MVHAYRVVQQTDTQFNFWDNFGNSAPILTIFGPPCTLFPKTSSVNMQLGGRLRQSFLIFGTQCITDVHKTCVKHEEKGDAEMVF